MAPTLRTDRRQWNPKGDIKHQLEDSTANAKKSPSDINLGGKLWKRTLLQLLGRDEDKDEDESEDESEDEDGHGDDRSNIGLPLTNPIPLPSLPSRPQPPPLPPLPSNPLSGLFPPPKPSPPPNSNPPAAAPPPQQPPPSSPPIPPQESPTGVTGNFGSASPSANRRTTLSAALPKSTSGGDDSDDDDDDDGRPSPTRSTFSKSTRSILSLTAAIPPYETSTTEEGGQKSSISSTESTTRSLATSTNASAQTPETTRAETTMTGIPSPSGETAAIGQGQEAASTSRLSPGAEKAVIASVTIGGFFILLVLAWFFWRRASRRKSAGRKSTWPTNPPSREIFDGPRGVSTKVGEKFTSIKAHEIFEGPRRVSSKVGEQFTSMKAHIRSGSFGWCSIADDDDAPKNEKSAAPVTTNAGGLLERRLGAMTPPQRVTVNSYGMIFRKPKRDSRLSDIFLPRGQQRTWPPSMPPSPDAPPSPEGIRIPIVRPNTQMAAAAHLENARKSVNAGIRNMPRTPRTPLRQNMRMSDVSSLSSGFGDGDIVIIQPPTAATAAKAAYPGAADTHVNVIAVRSSPERKHFSSRFSNRLSRGDTAGTSSSSEDGRPRFRSISSWVGQQSRRVRRAAANRNEDGVPDVPDVPPEQGFDMMMPDGQEPRRVESSMWKKT
ncbi:hypothetical protein THARTR1_03469 [Trichoderma harzianum]|uniref:Uncharacterized protein n=1 Tax=Trichoderma harzianum TaxID=5544 RepID=A0A2K0UG61_TRIHA|nr:hypothetical protein THARTR1_03469 [Trichoderma harzianum]